MIEYKKRKEGKTMEITYTAPNYLWNVLSIALGIAAIFSPSTPLPWRAASPAAPWALVAVPAPYLPSWWSCGGWLGSGTWLPLRTPSPPAALLPVSCCLPSWRWTCWPCTEGERTVDKPKVISFFLLMKQSDSVCHPERNEMKSRDLGTSVTA